MGPTTANWGLQTSGTVVLAIYPSKGWREGMVATVNLARRSGSSVVVVCVRENDGRARGRAEEILEEFTRSGVQARVWEISPRDVARKIAAAAQLCGAKLVVLGAHPSSGAAKVLFEDLAHRVLAEVDCPVMAVPGSGSEETGPASPAPRPREQRLLLALADRRDVQPLVDAALEVASGSSTEVLVVHCCQASTSAMWTFVESQDVGRDLVAKAVKPLRKAGMQATGMCMPASVDVVRRLLEMSGEWPADLIVMGSRKRSGVANLLRGGVEQRVTRQAPCLVLLVDRTARERGALSGRELNASSRAVAKARLTVLSRLSSSPMPEDLGQSEAT